MKVSKPVLFQFLILSIKLCYCLQSNIFFCPEIEKNSLLTLKQSLKDPDNLLSSWDGEVDCCEWQGVVCNNSTGHVTKLHLGNNQGKGLSGKINPSLVNLKYLTHLDLSRNNFTGETIPSFIGSFTNLQYLDLSNAGFQGKISSSIGNLSILHTLDLDRGWYYSEHELEVDSVEWLLGLSKLEHLNMNGANLSRATNWAKVITSLPSLLELHFSDCTLDFMSPLNIVNHSTSLTLIDLSYNNVNDQSSFPVPRWFFQLNNLLSLDLRANSFTGPIPTFINATKLHYIDLSDNHFNSTPPDWLYFCKDLEFLSLTGNLFNSISEAVGNLTSLKSLDLSSNQLSGKLPKEITSFCRIQTLDLSFNELDIEDLFRNMSGCFLGSLKELRLRGNKLPVHSIEQVGEFKSLRFLDLGYNSLSGLIPVSLGNLSSLEVLLLNDNNFTDNIPKSLGQLSNLQEFYIGNNKLEGIVTESHFVNLSKLKTFSASGNHLTLDVGQDWIPPIQLETLELRSWSLGLGSEIPSWLRIQRNITALDLSNTGISGIIPHWFFNIWFLNVSHNNLHGQIPNMIRSTKWDVKYLYMSYNNLSGPLPRIEADVTDLDLSHNSFSEGISDLICDTTYETYHLELLNLEGNNLSGELPDCWKKWPSLVLLKLGNNRLSGRIPNSIWSLQSLISLSLHDNKLSGHIPSAWQTNTNLLKIDLSHNNLDGNLPTWIGGILVNLKILILRSNKLSGVISSQICLLQSLQILDLSNNRFLSIIPRCISNFTAMATKRVLRLDYHYAARILYGSFNSDLVGVYIMESAAVVTKGVELEYGTILSLVTNIDFSMNNLSGEIPKELTSLVELKSLNLSGNHFTGSIPSSIGDMKQLESLDFSQNSLSGQIPNGFRLLYSLGHLNLSFNKLRGRIPESTQLQSLEASSFIGNDLCGPPLNNCSGGGDGHERVEKEGDDEKSEIEWLYVLLSLGYAVGLSGVCTALVLKKSWRDAYYGMLECMWDRIYVYLYVKWASLSKPAASTSPS